MKNAVFGYSTKNLGDDAQSVAASLLLGTIDTYVDRDALDHVRLDATHRLIMNSWFAIKRHNAIPHKSLEPIYFGYCAGRPEIMNTDWVSEWKRYGRPIGCRDTKTVAMLRDAGLDAYFSGCLTAWIGTFIEKPVRRDGVLFIDVPAHVEKSMPESIRGRAVRLTNETTPGASPFERLQQIAKTLDAIRCAELVVTRRLHAALPCVGLETPVIVYLSDDPKNRGRFSGHDTYLPIVIYDDAGSGQWIEPRVPLLPTECQEAYDRLAESVRSHCAPAWPSVSAFVSTLPDISRHATPFWKRVLPQPFASEFRA